MVVDRTVRRRRVDLNDSSTGDADSDAWRKTADEMKDTLNKADYRCPDQKKADLKASLGKSQAKKLSDKAWAKARAAGKSSHSSILCGCITFTTLLMFVSLISMAMISIPIKPVPFYLPPPPDYKGSLSRNNMLQYTRQILENELIGPESLAVNKETGVIYTGTYDGKIVSIEDGAMKVITQLGKAPCGKLVYEASCGRPLGIRIDKDGQLIVVDAYLGLFKINPKTGDQKILLSSQTKIFGVRSSFLNDIDIALDGTIYISDSSTKWRRKDFHLVLMEGAPDGRVIWYKPDTNTSGVLVQGLHFPNGLQLSPRNDILYISETSRARIMKYHLTGPLKGQTKVFNENLPGLPDNIRPSESGGYWVGFASVRMPEKFSIMDLIAPHPWMRNIMSKLMSQELFMKVATRSSYGLLVELDKNGKIIRSFHDRSGFFVPSVSEVAEHNGTLYLGSFYLPYLGVLDWKKYDKRLRRN
ncbi:adipocyte plasma membrane-associated protein-like [Lineus longissimus]|uniref:adipocyte plasma membrane-associated protein-like n=1 Tax=Lineus longissimus TaxID=88925 RepID=UPI002B4F1DF1